MKHPKIKIIHIDQGAHYDKNLPDFETRHYGTWATHFAKKTLEYTDKYSIEVWKTYDPYDYGEHGVSIREKKDITFKLFPASKIGPKYISIPLLKELRRRIKNKEKLIIHMQSVHGVMNSLIALYCSKIPLVAQQRGPNMPPLWRFKFKKNPLYVFLALIEMQTLKNIDFVFASSIGETKYVLKKLGPSRVMHLKGGGFDFQSYNVRSKYELRKELGLPLDKKILIHVGRFNELKGVDVIIEIYKELRRKHDNIEMIFIGGDKNQRLYLDVVNSGAVVKEYIRKDEVIKYINATDIHLLPTENKQWIPFGDIPTALVESLALNQPVVSPMLIHFAGTMEERKQLGFITKNRKEVLEAVNHIFNHFESFNHTRKIMKKYYNWNRIIENNAKIYDRLSEYYYFNK